MTIDRLERALKLAHEWAKGAVRHREAAHELEEYSAEGLEEASLHETEAETLERCADQLMTALKGDEHDQAGP